ncbi:MAG: anti-sigma factor family protein [Gemmatimonadaceae bacterium]
MSNGSMTCGRARRLLWPDGGPQVASAERIEAQEHLAGCAACQRFVREMRALGEAVREAAPREQAPGEVRSRLFAAIARARAGRQPLAKRRVARWWLAAAAVFVVALGSALTAGRLLRDAQADPISAMAEDHATALGGARVASGDPAAVTRWLAGQVHFAVYVPVLPGAQLRGARICMMDGRRGAVVEYEVDGVAVSYFVIPNGAADGGEPARFDHARRAGYDVVSWREPGLLHAMVGSVPRSRLVALARACVEQAGRAVAWLSGRALRVHTQEG